MAHSISVEPRPLGAYQAVIRVRDREQVSEPLTFIEYVVDAGSLRNLAIDLLRVEAQLTDRLLEDTICGDCQACSNTRMVDTRRHGNRWMEHCPRCYPLLQKAGRR